MKTLTKYTLILFATLPVSGCFSGDDKSYVDTVKTSSVDVQKIVANVKCWYSTSPKPTHDLEVYMINNSVRGSVHSQAMNFDAYVKGEENYRTLSVERCEINFY